MTINNEARQLVRQRADFCCEFCGVSETSVGGELTVDHYRPKTKGGSDELDNLLYCCPRCNLYKLDYWPAEADDPHLWNPRQEPASTHFLELDGGWLHPLTSTGAFTLQRLRLNRRPLVEHRRQRREQAEQERLLSEYRNLVSLIGQLSDQQALLMREQQRLLEEQAELLRLLLGG